MVSLHIFAQAHEHHEALKVDQAVRTLSTFIDSLDNEKKISIFDASTILSLIYDRPKEETLNALMQHRRAEGKAV